MIPVVERTLIDGVPVLRTESSAGRQVAALVFRVGRFDETLPTTGITHLVEHLALVGKPKASYEFNAAVGGRFTSFVMEGASPADTADYVASVCRGLAADTSELLGQETRVLRTEAASRGGAGAMSACLNERYGATGPGLFAYPEYGLRRLGWAEADAWRRRWFVAGNAVLCIAGEIPDGLRIDVPAGSAPAASPLRPAGARLPGYVLTGRGGIGMSLVGHHSAASSVALAILKERLTKILRHDRGLSYAVDVTSDLLDAHVMHAWLAADALPEHLSVVSHTMLSTFESLADRGPDSAEVEEYAQRMRTAFESASGPAMVVLQQAENLLIGRPLRQPQEALQAVSEVESRAVSEAARELLGQAIVATPQLVPAVQGRMPQLPQWSGQAITGTEFRSVRSGATLTVGHQGVTLTVGPGQIVTVHAGAVAALLRWNDGKRTLIGADGFVVPLDPAEWQDGAVAVGSVEAGVEPGLIVEIDSPGPASALPATTGQAAPLPATPTAAAPAPMAGTAAPPAPVPARVAVPRPRRSWGSRIIMGLLVAVILFGVLAIAGGDVGGAIFVGIGLAGVVWHETRLWLRARHRRADLR